MNVTHIGLTVSVFAAMVAIGCKRDDAPPAQSGAAPPIPAALPTDQWNVRPDRFGPIPLGATLAQVNAVSGDSLIVPEMGRMDCTLARSATMPAGAKVMLLRDTAGAPLRVERVDVDSATVHTAEGAGIGDAESRILSLYAGRVRTEPSKYTAGHVLVVESLADTLHRVVFETDGSRVVRFHAGRRPAVDQVEGCG